MPWGRGAEDTVTKKRERLGHLHMQERLRGIGKVVDSRAPKCVGLPHLYDRSKKKQLVVARQRVIDFENKKLVDSMAKILHGHGPPLHPYRPYKKGSSKTAVERRMIRERIGLENQFIADRLRNRIDPVIDHNEHAAFYAKATYIRNNISMSYRRDQRIARFKRKKERIRLAALSQSDGDASEEIGLATSESEPAAIHFDPDTMSTTLTKLRTAANVRAHVAKDRGQEIPLGLISSATKPPKQENMRDKKGGYRLQMDYIAKSSQGLQGSGTSGLTMLTPMMMGSMSLATHNKEAFEVIRDPTEDLDSEQRGD